MKILKLPFETTIKCECGCEFEFDLDDLEIRAERIVYGYDYKFIRNIVVQCPVCKKEFELSKEVEYEKNFV